MLNGNKIAVLGAGTMGSGISVTYALAGFAVSVYSRTQKTLDRSCGVMKSSLDLLTDEGVITAAEAAAAEKRISYTDSLEDAVCDAWYVTETVSERREIKRELYEKLDAILPDEVIIASDTSALNIFELMPASRLPYTAIAHFYAPAYILPLVEVVGNPETLPVVMDAVMELHRKCGKTPVHMERFVPGFIVNRLQGALNREIVYLLENGFCTPEELDLAVKTSLMPRGMLLGVVQRMDFAGLDMQYNGFHNKSVVPAPACEGIPKIIEERYLRGDLGVKTGKGFYDYSGQSYEDVLRHRDRQLLKSVKLAEEFMDDPLNNV